MENYKQIPVGRAKDLTGQQFGKLTVLYRVETTKKGTHWLCECECGKKSIVSMSHLTDGHTTSCGCQKKMKNLDNLVGKKFGKLTVLEYDKVIGKGHTYWKCQCDCGTIKSIRKDGLISGAVVSCGCFHKENIRKTFTKDLTGKQFGKLKVLEWAGSNKHNSSLWLCECECGTKKIIPSSTLIKGESNSCGCLKSKGEWKIASLLSKNNIPFEKEYQALDCLLPSKKCAKFDFYVDNKYFIEFDGVQHFEAGSGWNTEEKLIQTQINDKIKNSWCKKNNIPLIRIKYNHYNDLTIEDLKLETSKFII